VSPAAREPPRWGGGRSSPGRGRRSAGVERILELAATWVDWNGRARLSEDGVPHHTLAPSTAPPRRPPRRPPGRGPRPPRRSAHRSRPLARQRRDRGGRLGGLRCRRPARSRRTSTPPRPHLPAGLHLGRPGRLGRVEDPTGPLWRIAEHVGRPWYAEQVGDLTGGRDRARLGYPRRAEAELIYTEWDPSAAATARRTGVRPRWIRPCGTGRRPGAQRPRGSPLSIRATARASARPAHRSPGRGLHRR